MSPLNLHPFRSTIRFSRLVLLAGVLGFEARGDVKVGDLFPSLASAGLDGTAPATENKVVLVDFWASWCSPCKASFPSYSRLHHDYGPQGLVLVAVSVDQNPDDYQAFVKRLAPPFAVVRDQNHQLARQVMVPAMPTCFLVGRDGRVRFVHRGFHGAETDREIRREIELLLAEQTNPS